MKVCENCGEEIGTRDGDNLCARCDQAEGRTELKRIRHNAMRQVRERVMRELGLVKVRGELGGTYWE